MSKGPTLTVTKDFTGDLDRILKKFKRDAVLVGIPEENTDRKNEEPINNATILAINEFGSPANNIPARPVMAIGIRLAQPEIVEAFRKGAVAALSKGIAGLSTAYNRVGIVASQSVKAVINEQINIEEPSEATLAAREARGFKGTKALLVTGQLRNSITYVVRGED